MRRAVFLLTLLFLIVGCTSTTLISKECPKGIIPDRLFLTCTGYAHEESHSCGVPLEEESRYPITELWKWADGSPIVSQTYPICHTGYLEGENVNYIYCGGKRTKEMFWSKKETTEEGVILPEKRYGVKLILDFNDYIEVEHTLENPAPVHKGKKEVFRKYKVISFSCY